MPSLATLLALAASSAPLVLGHGHVFQVISGGQTYPGFTPWTTPGNDVVGWSMSTPDEGPVQVTGLQSPDIICHINGKNAAASVPVAAGDTLIIKTIGGQGGYEHPGPQLAYLAPCGDAGCAAVDKNNLRFFKIFESGLIQGGPADAPAWNTQRWATTEVHKSRYGEGTGTIDTFTVRIPASVRPGAYVLRHELIALHKAHEGKAEFYPQCINLIISGSGNELPDGKPATQLYSSSDPGVAINIWQGLQSYQIPGPPVHNFGWRKMGRKRRSSA